MKDILLIRLGVTVHKIDHRFGMLIYEPDITHYRIRLFPHTFQHNLCRTVLFRHHTYGGSDTATVSCPAPVAMFIHEFPIIAKGDFGHASDVILLETNCFTSPEPFTLMPVESLIAEFIRKGKIEGAEEVIGRYGLEKFEVNVLDINRTVAKKILGLVRASCTQDPAQELGEKIRHIYDLCLIKRDERYSQLFSSDALQEIIGVVIQADREQFREARNWLDKPLHECVLFSQPGATWNKIRDIFHGAFANWFTTMIFHLTRKFLDYSPPSATFCEEGIPDPAAITYLPSTPMPA